MAKTPDEREADRRKREQLARDAARIIDDPLFRQAVIHLEAMAMERLMALDTEQDLERFREVERIKVIRDIRNAFLQAIEAGKERQRVNVV